jgi:hypothetical protein
LEQKNQQYLQLISNQEEQNENLNEEHSEMSGMLSDVFRQRDSYRHQLQDLEREKAQVLPDNMLNEIIELMDKSQKEAKDLTK